MTDYLEDSPLEVIMPFGKHKGKRIGQVPVSYLKWFLETSDDVHSKIYKILFELHDDIYNACADDADSFHNCPEATLEDYLG